MAWLAVWKSSRKIGIRDRYRGNPEIQAGSLKCQNKSREMKKYLPKIITLNEWMDDLGSISDRKSLTSLKIGLSIKQNLSYGITGSKLGYEK